MTARLRQDAFAGIDQDDGHIGRGGAGGHIAGVLLVARGVGDDELAMGGREVAVSDIDGDSLLSLGPQTIGELGKIDRGRDIRARGFGHGAHVIFVDILRVVKQPAD